MKFLNLFKTLLLIFLISGVLLKDISETENNVDITDKYSKLSDSADVSEEVIDQKVNDFLKNSEANLASPWVSFLQRKGDENPLFSNNEVYHFSRIDDLSLYESLRQECAKEMNVRIHRETRKVIHKEKAEAKHKSSNSNHTPKTSKVKHALNLLSAPVIKKALKNKHFNGQQLKKELVKKYKKALVKEYKNLVKRSEKNPGKIYPLPQQPDSKKVKKQAELLAKVHVEALENAHKSMGHNKPIHSHKLNKIVKKIENNKKIKKATAKLAKSQVKALKSKYKNPLDILNPLTQTIIYYTQKLKQKAQKGSPVNLPQTTENNNQVVPQSTKPQKENILKHPALVPAVSKKGSKKEIKKLAKSYEATLEKEIQNAQGNATPIDSDTKKEIKQSAKKLAKAHLKMIKKNKNKQINSKKIKNEVNKVTKPIVEEISKEIKKNIESLTPQVENDIKSLSQSQLPQKISKPVKKLLKQLVKKAAGDIKQIKKEGIEKVNASPKIKRIANKIIKKAVEKKTNIAKVVSKLLVKALKTPSSISNKVSKSIEKTIAPHSSKPPSLKKYQPLEKVINQQNLAKSLEKKVADQMSNHSNDKHLKKAAKNVENLNKKLEHTKKIKINTKINIHMKLNIKNQHKLIRKLVKTNHPHKKVKIAKKLKKITIKNQKLENLKKSSGKLPTNKIEKKVAEKIAQNNDSILKVVEKILNSNGNVKVLPHSAHTKENPTESVITPPKIKSLVKYINKENKKLRKEEKKLAKKADKIVHKTIISIPKNLKKVANAIDIHKKNINNAFPIYNRIHNIQNKIKSALSPVAPQKVEEANNLATQVAEELKKDNLPASKVENKVNNIMQTIDKNQPSKKAVKNLALKKKIQKLAKDIEKNSKKTKNNTVAKKVTKEIKKANKMQKKIKANKIDHATKKLEKIHGSLKALKNVKLLSKKLEKKGKNAKMEILKAAKLIQKATETQDPVKKEAILIEANEGIVKAEKLAKKIEKKIGKSQTQLTPKAEQKKIIHEAKTEAKQQAKSMKKAIKDANKTQKENSVNSVSDNGEAIII